ncbi:26S proteasome non-ATPase regulatory subunit 10-like protein [Pilobolus umbonatus]|nr:26S proteasome non-ATPase regulatory subunit 10-like protein [Pilobolus umbonatus]
MFTVYQAAYEGKLFIVQQMIDRDASLLYKQDEDCRGALHWASSGGHVDIVVYLLNKGVSINAQDDAGWTPLMIAVSAGHTDVVRTLLEKGADVSLENQIGQSALHYAASKNRTEICRLLLEYKAPVNPLNHHKQTPL